MDAKSTFISVVKNKCPNCLEGDFFKHPNVYSFSKFDQMDKICSKCGMSFVQEPGFYFGAAIMSYVIQVFVVLLLSPFFMVLLDFSAEQFIFTAAGVLIILAPLTYRWARLLWINMLGKRPVGNS